MKMTKLCEASLRCQLMSERLCIINSGKAYDVTEFADRHPGGRKLLENHVGQDVTELMQNHENHKHSNSAYKILDKYYIGDLQVSNGLTYRGKTEINGNKLTNGFTNGHINGLSNGYSNGLSNGHSNGHTNGYMNGQTNGHMNGVANGHSEVAEEDLDSLVDWSKPIVWQVGDLGDKYFEWAHIPTDQPLRLFHSEICEFFSKSYWWLVLLYWVPITLGVIFYSYSQFLEHSIPWNIIGLGTIEVTPIYYPFLLIAGFLLWTLDEYVVHRWLFHCRPPGSSQLLIKIHFLFHGQHHKSPMDKSRLVFPPLPATLLAYIIFSLYKLFSPPLVALAMFAGTIIGYLMYDLVHYYLHHGHPSMAYFQNLKTYHVKHHFKHQNKGFGISSKLWDYPFGTLIE